MTSLLPLAAVQAADTVVMLAARDGLATAAAVADLAMAGVFVLILLGLALLFFQLRGIHGTVRELSGRLEKRLDPVIDRGKEVAANVEFITGALRTDVQRVSDSVKSLSDRLQSASDRMEQRVEEFNALMEVVQTEAEDIFIGSAAAIHGVRAGARALRDGPGLLANAGGGGDGSELDDADEDEPGPRAERGEAAEAAAAALEPPPPELAELREAEAAARRSGGA